MTEKICACCDNPIPHSWDMCKIHLGIYGKSRKEWPEWLIYLVKSKNHERHMERYHQEELLPDDDFGYFQSDNNDVAKRNEYLANRRSQWINRSGKTGAPPQSQISADPKNQIETRIDINAAIKNIEVEEWYVLGMSQMGFNYREIGEIMGFSRTTVGAIYRHAVDKMAEQLTYFNRDNNTAPQISQVFQSNIFLPEAVKPR